MQTITQIDFKEWFENKLKIVGYPKLEDIIGSRKKLGRYTLYDVIINVSDEFYIEYATEVMKSGRQYYWFPMGEMHEDMGMTSLFGALQVLYQAYCENYDVILHCHAGANRSPTVQAALYYMMTGEHIQEEMKGGIIVNKGNMLLNNCGKHLYKKEMMENWLKACKEAFDNPQNFIGGMYDWTIRRMYGFDRIGNSDFSSADNFMKDASKQTT